MSDPGSTATADAPVFSVVVPFFNEEDNLAPLVDELTPVIETLGPPFELILIDDGSTDGGSGVAAKLATGDPRIRWIQMSRRQG